MSLKETYKCSCCGCWYEKIGLDHISHSTDEKGNTKQYIKCKNCVKAKCSGGCKYMPK